LHALTQLKNDPLDSSRLLCLSRET